MTISKLIVFAWVLTSMVYSANWSNNKVEILYGTDYKKIGSEKQIFLTFAHANGWAYGDNFYFFDVNRDEQTETISHYGEWAPRLSLSKIFNTDLSLGLLTDISLAATFEFPRFGINQLYGVGFDWKVPKFKFFKTMAYLRDNPNKKGVTYQATVVWSLPIDLGSVKLLSDGFVDYAGEEGEESSGGGVAYSSLNAQPTLLLDLGHLWGTEGSLYLGIEYLYWKNKFGIDGVDENQVQALTRWKF